MTDAQVIGLCRLTIRAPARSIDLAVPADVRVADLLPAVLGHAGDDLAEEGIEHAGWILQRLGGRPLDDERTLDSYTLSDGETLHLRPRTGAPFEVHLDDPVDGGAPGRTQTQSGDSARDAWVQEEEDVWGYGRGRRARSDRTMNGAEVPREPMDRRVANDMAQLQAVGPAVARAEEDPRNIALTARSRDRSVEVTVGPQGELTGPRFLNGRYRNMPAAQLAAAVLQASEPGRAEMAYRVREIFEPITRPGAVAPEFGGCDVDWDRILGSANGGAGFGGGRSASDRLRDEIHDDPDDGQHDSRGGGRS